MARQTANQPTNQPSVPGWQIGGMGDPPRPLDFTGAHNRSKSHHQTIK